MAESSVESLAVDRSSPGLQWGRDLSIAESNDEAAQRLCRRSASMGPRSLDRGIMGEAAEFVLAQPASMGPRSLDRGIPSPSPSPTPIQKELQWGRDLSIAESAAQAWLSRAAAGFNGAAISRSRNHSRSGAVGEVQRHASMGPRSLDRGILKTKTMGAQAIMSFNGAAISRSRNRVRLLRSIRATWALQWGRDLSIAESRRTGETKAEMKWASMGPRSLDRGIAEGY